MTLRDAVVDSLGEDMAWEGLVSLFSGNYCVCFPMTISSLDFSLTYQTIDGEIFSVSYLLSLTYFMTVNFP